MLNDFKRFLLRGNVIDLAVAVVIGAAFTAIVAAFSTDLTEMTFEINGSTFSYGLVLDAAIRFVATAVVVFFFVVKPVQVINERRARGEVVEDAPAPSDEAVLLGEIRDLLAARQ